MSNCNAILSIHTGMGTTQNDRIKPALQPGYFRLDERSEQDFILFVQKLSAYVKFYNEFDMAEGSWKVFFEKESTSILILIANWNIELLQSSFKNKEHEILINAESAEQKELLVNYFAGIKEYFGKLSEKTNLLDDEIIDKQNLLASSYTISDKLDLIINQASSSADIPILLKNYVFAKSVQQLFGLLTSWKSFSQNAIDNQLNGYAKHTPHYALFLAFIKLLNVAKEKLNEFTKNHLDFYYRDILRVQSEEAKPDYVHLIAEPHNTVPFLLPKGTIFPAGKNTAGQNKFYASTADHTANAAKLNSFVSSYLNNSKYYKTDLLPLNGKNKGFNAFTTNQSEFKEDLMIASPLFFLQSGERYIYLQFNNQSYNADDFNFFITGKEKIIEITDKDTTISHEIKLTIPAEEKSIVPYDEKLHAGFVVSTSFPVLKIVPKNTAVISSISRVEITVKVNRFRSYILNSDFGPINTEKPFYPFGEFPKSGNAVFVSSKEFFMKDNAQADFVFTSMLAPVTKRKRTSERSKDIPYSTRSKWLKDKVTIFQLDKSEWKEYSDSLKTVINNYPLKEYNFEDTDDSNVNGKIKIELDYYKYNGETFMQDFIQASQDKTTLPYKPRFKEFVFNYTVTQSINLLSRRAEANPVEIYKSLPFGFEKIRKGIFRFSQSNPLEGNIYLGFENAGAQDALTFLIQLEEGTANPQLEPAAVKWKYLTNNRWEDLPQEAIGDETLSLTQSGLVNITVPDHLSNGNTKMASGLFWLMMSISNIQAISNLMGVHTQALKAVLADFENTGAAFTEPTPKETISKTYRAINGIKKMLQPYASFSGRIAEPDENLYTRISERLRHKNRAITTWDYEKIILQAFPEVYRVKALNHYKYDTQISNVAAGYVTLIPVAKSSPSDNISWKPLLSLNKMLRIKEHLQKVASPHARINIKPPKAELVQVHFKVKFRIEPGMDSRLYVNQLKQTINEYLSPWAYENAEVNFAGNIEFSSIIQLIDNQNYVDYLTDFKISQYMLDENNEITGSAIQNLNKITPQTDFTLFIPNDTHQIEEI